MEQNSLELLRFRRCRNLHGDSVDLTFGRRNGKPAVFFQPESEITVHKSQPRDLTDQAKLFVNLNPLESATWYKLLQAQSVASIAREEGVSRTAVYSRIQGNSRGQGGMIAKNVWVLLWWKCRQSTLNHNDD